MTGEPAGDTDDRELLERLELFVGMEVNETLVSVSGVLWILLQM